MATQIELLSMATVVMGRMRKSLPVADIFKKYIYILFKHFYKETNYSLFLNTDL